MKIYIRPLQIEDALISYKWRNNLKIWKFTGSKPNIEITSKIEKDWIENVINRKNEKRFSICIKDTNEYIGNVQLTSIKNKKAEFHIFIGETSFWGKGIGHQATKLILEYGFNEIGLNNIFLNVKEDNKKAVKLYEKIGFARVINHLKMTKMSINKENFINKSF